MQMFREYLSGFIVTFFFVGEGENGDDEEQSVEDDPLNSGDDQSDDEDIDTLFDADNVVMCQFEKVRLPFGWLFFVCLVSLAPPPPALFHKGMDEIQGDVLISRKGCG